MFFRMVWVGALSSALALAGCGSGITAANSGSSLVTNTNLNGNWLLVGTLPFTALSGTPANSAFGVAGTFSVVGNNVEAALSDNLPCAGGAVSGPGAVVQGTIGSDGSVTMQTSTTTLLPLATAKLTGVVPANGATSWGGHLTFANGSTTCPTTQDLNFTAVRIADVTGTYLGTSPVSFTNGSTFLGTQTATFSIALHQGVVLTGTSTLEAQALSGTVNVQGVPCFSSGTISSSSGVLGSEFEVQMVMNDGLAANFLGEILDTSTAKLTLDGVFGSGSTCGTFFSAPFTIVRQ